jgi:processive 1,2-diacylglycerol beta-glucosyltransferase
MTKILILHVEAGHGHRKVAEAIQEEIQSRNLPDVEVEVLDALTRTNWLFQKTYPQVYFQLVLWAPWLWGFFFYFSHLKLIYALIAPLRFLWNRFQSGKLRAYLKEKRFDTILFTHFFPAEVCASAKARGEIDAELITIVTDVIPHRVWQNPGTDEYWVMAEESAQALKKQGVSELQIHVGGIPISKKFLEPYNRNELKIKYGFNSDGLTMLFTSGSFGIGPTEATLDSFSEFGNRIQALVVCGKNDHLYNRLKERAYSFPVVVFGFVDNMHEIMSCADLLIAKPGGATMCESLAKGIPIIISGAIPGQESYNAEWLLKHQAAFQMKTVGDIKNLVSKILEQPQVLETTKQGIGNIAKPFAAREVANFLFNRNAYRR